MYFNDRRKCNGFWKVTSHPKQPRDDPGIAEVRADRGPHGEVALAPLSDQDGEN